MLTDCVSRQNSLYVAQYKLIMLPLEESFAMLLSDFISIGTKEVRNPVRDDVMYMFMGTPGYTVWQ